MKVFLKFFLFLFLFFNFSFFVDDVRAQENESFEAVVVNILDEKENEGRIKQYLELEILNGSRDGEKIYVQNEVMDLSNNISYQKFDKVMIMQSGMDGEDFFIIVDYVRRGGLFWLFLLFVFFAMVVGRQWGFMALLGMGVSFGVLFKFVLPWIVSGMSPVLAAIFASMLIIPITFYLSHGISQKTHVAVLSTFLALIITGILSVVFVEITKLTGFASEEAAYLHIDKDGLISIKGLLLAGLIISTLGVLDDVTVNQAGIVEKLWEVNDKLSFADLYKKAMSVGQDHVSSMVNTLVLVYTGAAMPLLLLFIDGQRSFLEVINYEIVAEEIVRMLVGSIGLIVAVPITTFFAVSLIKRK
jgi:uncharacterized membrane protein